MRKCYLAFFTLFLASYVSYSQWEIQNSGVSVTLWDVCFVDNLYGWAVGDSGTIIATVDGGKSWLRKIESVDSVEFRQVQFLTRDIGFVGGNRVRQLSTQQTRHVIVLQTTNGGFSWERCDSTFGSDFSYQAMEFLDSYNGWIALNTFGPTERKGMLLKTTDGGQSWVTLLESSMLKKNFLLITALTFFNTEQGYSFWTPLYDNFDATDVYLTQNGGKEWKWTGRIEMETAVKAKCPSPDTLWARGWNISRSQDGGKTWKTWNWSNPVVEGQKRFFAGDFEALNSNNVWLLGNSRPNATEVKGILLRTSNSGDNWWSELEVPDRSFGGLSIVSGKEAWIVGSNGLTMHMKNNVTDISKEADAFNMPFEVAQNYPNPFNSSTSILFNLARESEVVIYVYDFLGRLVNSVDLGILSKGRHQHLFHTGFSTSGIFLYQIVSADGIGIGKMVVIK